MITSINIEVRFKSMPQVVKKMIEDKMQQQKQIKADLEQWKANNPQLMK